MHGCFQPIPYPTHKSPMDGDTANRDLDWLLAASTDRVFALPIGAGCPPTVITLQRKLDLLASRFWPALARWVAARQIVLPGGGPVLGGWWRPDMHGMLDWYRDCLHLVSRWDDAVAAHTDGVWRVALESSPWRDWPEFAPLLREPVVDRGGRPARDGAGRMIYRRRDPRAEGMEDAFLDVWEVVANSRPIRFASSSAAAAAHQVVASTSATTTTAATAFPLDCSVIPGMSCSGKLGKAPVRVDAARATDGVRA